MNDVLGLIDALEASVMDAKKMPMTDKVMLNQKQVLALIDKLRFLVRNRDAARKAVDLSGNTEASTNVQSQSNEKPVIANAGIEVILKAKREAKEIESQSNEYADNVLAQLQLLVTKLQKNLIRLEKNVEDGRSVLEEKQKALSPDAD